MVPSLAGLNCSAPLARDVRRELGCLSVARDLFALTKPRVTLLVAATAAAGMWLATRMQPMDTSLLALAGIAGVVGAANALNCWLERDVDCLMERTRQRPLAAGRLDSDLGLAFGLILGSASVMVLAVWVNVLSAVLAFAALVTYVWVYTPLKRRSAAALFVGAVPGAVPPLLGWTAATNQVDAPAILLFAILYWWQLPHFLSIGLVYREDYARAGFRTLPVVWGDAAARRCAAIAGAALIPASVGFVIVTGLGELAFVASGLLGSALFAVTLCCLVSRAKERSARALLVASLAYLPLLIIAFAVGVS